MLSLSPSLLAYEQLAPALIRLVLAAVLIFWAYKSLGNRSSSPRARAIGVIEGIAGILLVIGLWTQAAAAVTAIDLIIRLVERAGKKAFLTDGVNYYLLLLVMAFSLLVTGAGFLAFDLPL